MMLGAFAETSAAAVPQLSCCRAAKAFCSQPDETASQQIQNWYGKGSYKTRIWFSQKGRSAGFYFSSELLQSFRFVEAATSTFSP
jgi:hypothetical protein